MAIDGHYYSVPCALIKKDVEARITHWQATLEDIDYPATPGAWTRA